MPRTRLARQVARRRSCTDLATETRRSPRIRDHQAVYYHDVSQDSDIIILDESIDLTSALNEDVVDLTSPSTSLPIDLTSSTTVDLTTTRIADSPNRSLGANDHSVIVIETQDADDSLPSPEPVLSPPRVCRAGDMCSPDSDISCPVCLDSQKVIKKTNRKLVSTKCGHVFCNKCIDKAFDTFKACPVCRKKQRKSDLRVLHI